MPEEQYQAQMLKDHVVRICYDNILFRGVEKHHPNIALARRKLMEVARLLDQFARGDAILDELESEE